MKNLPLTILSICTVLIALFVVTDVGGPASGSGNVKTSIEQVLTFDGTQVIPYAGSSDSPSG